MVAIERKIFRDRQQFDFSYGLTANYLCRNIIIGNYMSGSGASNLGYGNAAPLSNIDGRYVNVGNTNDPARFTSHIIPGTPPGPLPGMAGVKNNVAAANASIMVGGRGRSRRQTRHKRRRTHRQTRRRTRRRRHR